MCNVISEFVSGLGEIKQERDVLLSSLSTFKIGGPADIAVYPETSEELITAIKAAKRLGLRYTVIGNGSNILFDDKGYRGAVISTGRMRELKVEGTVSALFYEGEERGRPGLFGRLFG